MTAAERAVEIEDGARTYGPTWATSSLLAECRHRLASVERYAVDGDAATAAEAAKDAAAVALALALRLAARVPS